MDLIESLANTARVATTHDKVLNSECAYTFHSPFTTSQGIVVNLNTFQGTVQPLALQQQQQQSAAEGLFVRIVKVRKEREAPVDAPTQLGIGVDGGFQTEEDKYETISTYSIVVLRKNGEDVEVAAEEIYSDETKSRFSETIQKSVDSILHHVGVTLQQEVAVWKMDEEIPVSKYAENLPVLDNGVNISPDPSTWKCQKSGDTENVWLNLSDGYMGGGRRHWDGSGGSNGALDHFEETGRKYPLVVKLGTITADLDTADCYSYAPYEDGPVKIPNLADLLSKRGIHVASLQKTVKSTAELEVELNATYAFDAITESGSALVPVTGAGLQGLQNLGNSCYMNSVLQLLLSGTVPELAARYGSKKVVDLGCSDTEKINCLIQHPLILSITPQAATTDLLCQTVKIGSALTSGAFARPANEQADNDPKYRLAPRMFKHVIGKDHVDFCTGQQQDAAHFLQYLLERWETLEQRDGKITSSHLLSFSTKSRLQCSMDHKVKYVDSSAETMWSLRIPMDKASVREQNKEVTSPEQKKQKSENKDPVPSIDFYTCVEEWAKETTVEGIRWPHLQNAAHAALQQTRFATYPRYLLIQMQRYQLGPDWTPMKLEVLLDIPEEIDLNGYRASGPHPDESIIVEEEELRSPTPSGPNIDEAALAQLMDMGFSMNSCKRALNAVGGSDVEAAMGWVFEHSTDPDFNDPLPEASSSSAATVEAGVDEGVVQSLVENLGMFTSDQVRAALKACGGAADRAADWLFSNMDDLDAVIASLDNTPPSSGSESKIRQLEDGDGNYSMIGMISHIGKHTGSGHYIAHLKKNGKWVIFNDEKVALSDKPPFEHAYLYLFQRKDTIGKLLENF